KWVKGCNTFLIYNEILRFLRAILASKCVILSLPRKWGVNLITGTVDTMAKEEYATNISCKTIIEFGANTKMAQVSSCVQSKIDNNQLPENEENGTECGNSSEIDNQQFPESEENGGHTSEIQIDNRFSESEENGGHTSEIQFDNQFPEKCNKGFNTEFGLNVHNGMRHKIEHFLDDNSKEHAKVHEQLLNNTTSSSTVSTKVNLQQRKNYELWVPIKNFKQKQECYVCKHQRCLVLRKIWLFTAKSLSLHRLRKDQTSENEKTNKRKNNRQGQNRTHAEENTDSNESYNDKLEFFGRLYQIPLFRIYQKHDRSLQGPTSWIKQQVTSS
ncbi:hypothetical protein L9F63_012218, partial [Diploptera punctata]